MTKYRFITPHRAGKWYPELEQAQRFANAIGAGFLDHMTGRFVAYRDTRIEVANFPD
jgi:imidazoleglycerol phosphate dehydratase HisB